MLNGERGAAAKLAMSILVQMAEVYAADELIGHLVGTLAEDVIPVIEGIETEPAAFEALETGTRLAVDPSGAVRITLARKD